MKHVVFAAIVCLGSGCLASDQFTHVAITQADATIDPAKPDAPATVHMTLSLMGGDRDHTAVLDAITLGTPLAPLGDLALAFNEPEVFMQAKTLVEVPLVVAGDIPNRLFAGHCESTMPVHAEVSFADTANLSPLSPDGEIAVFCP